MTATELLTRTISLVETGVAEADAVATLVAAGASPDAIRHAQAHLLEGLARNPFVDRTGILAGRLLWAALDATEQSERTPSLARAA